jgi:glycosyltransferase involved in cell wall biosynthesis
LRIGLLIYGDLNSLSGGYLYDRKLLASLQRQGDSVEVYTLPQRTWMGGICHQADLNELVKSRLDVLIQDELVHPSVYRVNPGWKHRTRIPVVGLVHLFSSYAGQPFHRRWLHCLVEQRYLESVDGLILNSRNSLDQARRLLHDRLPPYVVAAPAGDNFPGLESPNAPPPAPASGPVRILYAGNVIRQKGLHVLLQALHKLPRKHFQLTVAGRLDMEPRYVSRIRATIKAAQLEGNVNIAGPLPLDAMAGLYQSHHLLALPSVNEAYGIVYIEAQQFGLPVIGTTAGGAGEIITHGYNGFLIEPGDSAALARLLAMLYADRRLLQTLGRHALETFRQHPGWEDCGRLIRRFLLELVSSAGNK